MKRKIELSFMCVPAQKKELTERLFIDLEKLDLKVEDYELKLADAIKNNEEYSRELAQVKFDVR